MVMMHKHLQKLLKNFDVTMENKGKSLLITVKGDEDEIKALEKKLNAVKELCSDCEDGEGCCCC